MPARIIRLTSEAEESLRTISRRGQLSFCSSAEDAIALIEQVLRQDIRSVHQGRGRDSPCDSSSYMCHLDALQISFTTTLSEVIVSAIAHSPMDRECE